MKIYSVYDKEFRAYGAVREGDFSGLLRVLAKTECPEEGTVYVASYAPLEADPATREIERELYGGMPIQIGYCNGHNVRLDCLEFHKSSEIDMMESDTVLFLGLESEIRDGKYDTSLVRAFLVPAGCAVELYATTLHYAPCRVDGGFRMVVILPRGTNLPRPASARDPMLFGCNKWLLAHPDAPEIRMGAYNGLTGENLVLT